MHRRIAILLFLGLVTAASLVWTAGWTARAEVLDKITAVVDGRIITLSDIRKEREIGAILGDPSEPDESILKSLIDRALLEGEMAQYAGLEVEDEEVDERMKLIQDFRGIPPAVVRDAVARKMQRQQYFRVRYRQFIVVSNEDIANYYETKFVPEVKQRGVTVPALDQVVNQIRENIAQEKMSQDLESSLVVLRARSNIEVFQ